MTCCSGHLTNPGVQVGEAAGVRDEALRTVDRLRVRLRRTAGQAAAAAATMPSRPRVLVLQSLRPLHTVGWWLPDQVTLAGGTCEGQEASGDAAVDLTWEQVGLGWVVGFWEGVRGGCQWMRAAAGALVSE